MLADRCDRRQVLVWSCVVRAVLVAGLAGGVVAAAPPALLVALVFAATLAGTPCYPALAAAIPTRRPTDRPGAGQRAAHHHRDRCASWSARRSEASCSWSARPGLVLAINALCFVAALALFVPVGVLPAASAAEAADSFGGALAAGLRTIVGSGRVLAPMLLVVSVNLVYGGSLVCLAAYARAAARHRRERARRSHRRARRGRARRRVPGQPPGPDTPTDAAPSSCRPCWPACRSPCWPWSATPVAAAVCCWSMAGAASIVTEVLAVTLLQRSLPSSVIARVFGVLDALVIGAVLVGAAVMHPMIEVVGLETADAS